MSYSKTIITIIIGSGIFIISFFVQHQEKTAPVVGAKLTVLDVGEGQAMYLRTFEGADVLINGGPDRTVLERLGKSMSFWNRTIELVILTDTQPDHITGLLTLLDYYSIQEVWLPEQDFSTNNMVYRIWLEQLAQHHVSVQYKKIQEYQFGKHIISFSDNVTIIDGNQAIISGTPQFTTFTQVQRFHPRRVDQEGTVELYFSN